MSKILVVDDNAFNLKLARDVLEMAGHETQAAVNGREAVEIAVSEHPDLILMDLRMPVMNGEDAMNEVKTMEYTQDIPVVALTASAMLGECEKLLGRGFDGYISKPIDVATFADKVETFLQGGMADV